MNMQIKTTKPLQPLWGGCNKKDNKCWQGLGEIGTFMHCWCGGIKSGAGVWIKSLTVTQMLNRVII